MINISTTNARLLHHLSVDVTYTVIVGCTM